jgi:CHAD domain-containing protein
VTLRGLAGQKRSLDLAVGALKAAGASKAHADDLELVAAARGRHPGDYSSKLRLQLDPDQRSDEALREILSTLLETLRANVEGVIADHDVEFLHDFRVASRRTRSALGQIKGVLPQRRVVPFVREFKWLGTVTGPCRDLDVYLLEMATYRQMLSSQSELLEPLERLIETSRGRAHRAVVRGLGSRRFARLIDRWSAFLAEPPAVKDEPPDAGRPVAELAGDRILKAYRRMLKRGGRLGEDPPAADLHRLRIDAKKLRYLLEFFASLYSPKVTARLVKELKKLQDILGGFNDMEVQQARLIGFARELEVPGERGTDTMLAMGRLGATLEARQEDYRLAFAEGFEAFASPASQKTYRKLCSGS